MKITNLNDAFFSRLEAMSLNLKANLAGYFGGKHLVKTYGQTVEFADFREYQFGDDIRRIDWNLFSRFEKYFLRLFTDERQMQVQIFLDLSGSMGKDDPQKGAYAVSAAAALGFLAVQNMDKLTFQLMRGKVAENPFGTIVGKNAFFRAMSTITELDFDDDIDLEACITGCPTTGDNNGITVIVSDFFTESNWKKAVDYLCFKKRQVLLLQVLSPEEIDPSYDGRMHLLDSEASGLDDEKNMKLRINSAMQKAYEEALRDYLGEIRDYTVRRGVDFISVSSATPIERVLFGEFLKTGIMS